MDPKDAKPNLLTATFGGVPVAVDLGACGGHALAGGVARLDPDFDCVVPEMWTVELAFRPEYARDRVTGEERRPIEVGHFSHAGVARAVAEALTARLAEIAAERGALGA